jgi:hypothetical protein
MTKVTTTLNGLTGKVAISVAYPDDRRDDVVKLQWFDTRMSGHGGTCGFIASFSEERMVMSEVAAESFIRMLVEEIMKALKVDYSDLDIVNHLGDWLDDIEFMPPTFSGNSYDVEEFIRKQNILQQIYNIYNQDKQLSSRVLEIAKAEDVFEDFISLVNVHAFGFELTLQ